MTNKSVFDKRHGEDATLDKVGGLLEQFNLPPAFIEYVRKHHQHIKIVLLVTVVLVISGSLYKTYRENRIENAALALSQAMQKSSDEKSASLKLVMSDYSGTGSASWAELELAHIALADNQYDQAKKLYLSVLDDTNDDNPLYPLCLLGLGQVADEENDKEAALKMYNELKEIHGYEGLGYSGIARTHEINQENEKAIAVYEQYMVQLAEYPANHPEKLYAQEKIAKLKSIQ